MSSLSSAPAFAPTGLPAGFPRAAGLASAPATGASLLPPQRGQALAGTQPWPSSPIAYAEAPTIPVRTPAAPNLSAPTANQLSRPTLTVPTSQSQLQPSSQNAFRPSRPVTTSTIQTRNKPNTGLLGGRTKGMWLFDSLLYPVLTNAGVFAISVLATYATTYGGARNFMRLRGDWAREQLQKLFKMSPQSAKETIMITFSFLDGCAMAPVVKLFEDRRNQIAEKFDQWMGSTPQDKSVYDQEPKQTWGSVLGGRTAAFALVLPTAKVLSRKNKAGLSLNERMFAKPGQRIGQALERALPSLQRRFPKLNIPGLAEVCALEAFYTALCTTGLYVSSRFFAKHHGQQAQQSLSSPTLPTA